MTSAYVIHHKVINTSDPSVPQSWQIWYSIGFLRSAHLEGKHNKFPQDCPPSKSLLDKWRSEPDAIRDEESKNAQDNIANVKKQALERGINPSTCPIVVDVDASK